ncbi:MAG: hypothetical protein R3F34_19870 [Planctomycetota bacterium]
MAAEDRRRTEEFDDARGAFRRVVEVVAARRDPLRERVRVLVPDGPTRLAVAGALVRLGGGALLGVRVGTLLGAAVERLSASGERVRASDAAQRVALGRLLERSSELARVLTALDDGIEVGVRAVEELVRAGFRSDQERAALEAVRDALGGAARERAEDLVRLAAARAPGGALQGGTELAFARAAELVREKGLADELGGAGERTLLIGCDAAQGHVADLAEAFVANGATALVLRGARGALAARLGVEATASVSADDALRVDAPDRRSAARAVARILRDRVDAGVAPESLLVVSANPRAHGAHVRRAFLELGLPHSAPGVQGPVRGASRALDAFGRFLERGDRTSASTLSAASADDRAVAHRAATDGAVRLGDASGAPFDDARAFTASLEGAPRDARAWNAAATAIAAAALGHREDGDVAKALASELDAVAATLPDGFELHGPEWARLSARALRRAAREPFGGSGGGVQVAGPDGVLGRSVDTLVLLGFDRETFPRRGGDDPLLDDELRGVLRAIVPDLATRAEARARDEALLDAALGAAEHVRVVHAHTGDGGRPALLAPALERRSNSSAHGRSSRRARARPRTRSAERSPRRLGATRRRRARRGRRVARTLRALARAPRRIAGERAGPRGPARRARPRVGRPRRVGTRRSETAREGRVRHVARAPRRSAVGRRTSSANSRSNRRPAATSRRPTGARSGSRCTPRSRSCSNRRSGPRRSMERPCTDRRDPRRANCAPRSTTASRARSPSAPAQDADRRRRRRVARRTLLPLVERGVDYLWLRGDLEVLATEWTSSHRVRRRARRVRRRPRAATRRRGSSRSTSRRACPCPTPRRRRRASATSRRPSKRGERLQGGVYATALLGRGAYLGLGGDDVELDRRETSIDAATAAPLVEETLEVVLRARRFGLFLPRLVKNELDDESQPDQCSRCAVADACVQGDTAWRERQRAWSEAVRTGERDVYGDDAESAAIAWFALFEKKDREAAPEDGA